MSALHPNLDRAVLDARSAIAAIKRGETLVRTPSRDELRRFGVGGPCAGSSACGIDVPGRCYEKVAQENKCELKTVTGGQLGVAGLGLINFTVDLDLSEFFMPLYVRLFGMVAATPDTPATWKLTAARIGKIPQECFDESNPVPATHAQGVFSTSWDHFQVDGKQIVRSGVRVKWGMFSRQTLSKPLQIFGFNPAGAATPINVFAEVTGYCIDWMPCGWQCGKYPGDKHPDGGGGGGGGGGGVPGMGAYTNPQGGQPPRPTYPVP